MPASLQKQCSAALGAGADIPELTAETGKKLLDVLTAGKVFAKERRAPLDPAEWTGT